MDFGEEHSHSHSVTHLHYPNKCRALKKKNMFNRTLLSFEEFWLVYVLTLAVTEYRNAIVIFKEDYKKLVHLLEGRNCWK